MGQMSRRIICKWLLCRSIYSHFVQLLQAVNDARNVWRLWEIKRRWIKCSVVVQGICAGD
jgi:hypothetical protein